ncbi:MAG: extracellular solute-binding protein, partial [bacterium]
KPDELRTAAPSSRTRTCNRQNLKREVVQMRKAASIILAVLLLVGIGLIPSRPLVNAAASFSDVEATSYWATKEIGILDGALGTYSPTAVTITLWEQMDPGEKTLLEKNIVDFTELYKDVLNVTWDIVHYDTEDLRANFQAAALANSGPDLVYGPNDNVAPFSTMNLIKPLETIFESTFFDALMPNAVGSMQLNGHIWGVPDRIGNHLMLIYNKTLVPEPPKNTDEMIAMAKALYKEEGGNVIQWGLVYNDAEPFFFVPWLGGFGGWVMDDNNAPTLDSQAMVDALTFAKSLQDQKVVPTGNTYDTAEVLFKEGNAGFIINGDWALGGYEIEITDFEFRVTRIPQVVATGLWPTPMVSSKGYSIAAACPESKLFPIAMFLRYMTTPEVQSQWTNDLHILPSSKIAMEDPIIASDPILKGSAYQVEVGKPMPTVPEMRAVWDAISPQLQGVLGGSVTPADAALTMQTNALEAIKAMSAVYALQPNWNMLSLPVMPDSSNPSVVFGSLPSGWLLYAWDAANGRYLGKDLIVLNQEEAYWLKVSTAVSYSVIGQPNGAAQTEIDLSLGWNMIGVPYGSPIPWSTVLVSKDGNPPVSLDQAVASNWIQGTLFRWSGSAYQALTSTTGGSFLPLSGYWAKAKVGGVQLILPKP